MLLGKRGSCKPAGLTEPISAESRVIPGSILVFILVIRQTHLDSVTFFKESKESRKIWTRHGDEKCDREEPVVVYYKPVTKRRLPISLNYT